MMKQWFSVDLRVPLTGHSKESIYKKIQATGLIDDDKPDDRRVVITKKGLGGRGKGKSIGSDYERRIAEKLSAWWGCAFRRTPNSGGWDKQVKDGQNQAIGDIIAPPEAHFPFSVECKKRREPVSLFSPSSELFTWWKQCCSDAATSCKQPMLVFNTDGTDYVMVPWCVQIIGEGVVHMLDDDRLGVVCHTRIARLDSFLDSELIDAISGNTVKAAKR